MHELPRAAELITELALMPHPERGYYAETFRSSVEIQATTHAAPRVASTAIYYLVTNRQPASRIHRLKSDEVFHFYEGGPLSILCLHPDGSHATLRLGLNLSRGERPQHQIAAGTWFGTELAPAATHCLVGCTVAPGFEFTDFELGQQQALCARYPQAADVIQRMM